MFLNKNNQTGATMLETLGVLTITVMLGISIIKLVGNAYNVFKQSLVTNEIKDLQKAISDRYKFDGNYNSLFDGRTTDQVASYLCSQKIAPFQMCVGGKLVNRMGGSVTVSSVGEDNKYAIVFSGLSGRACVNMAQINWYTQKKADIFRMIINAGTSKQLTVDLPQNKQSTSVLFPVDASTAMRACYNDGGNDIQWIFF